MEYTQEPTVMPDKVAIKTYKLPYGYRGPKVSEIEEWLKCKESPSYFNNTEIA
jgi:hypothetical protein